MWDADQKERDEARRDEVIREFVEHDIEDDGLARAIFKCRMLAVDPMLGRAELAKLVTEHEMGRRANKTAPIGAVSHKVITLMERRHVR